jgi:hypothetical protein
MTVFMHVSFGVIWGFGTFTYLGVTVSIAVFYLALIPKRKPRCRGYLLGEPYQSATTTAKS